MGFHVELSSDINGLVRALGDQLQRDLQGERIDLFHSPSIIVPHANLARWATLRLAHHLGIAANLDFPYLEGALWQALSEHDTAQHSPTRLDATTLQRLINALFTVQTALRDDPVMQPMWEYISGGATLPDDWPSDTQRRAWQLADRVARLFLEYECQRPEMIAAWRDGHLHPDPVLGPVMQGWQQRLYHAIFRPDGWRDQTLPDYRTLPQYRAMVEIASFVTDLRPLYLFGLSHTSPFHLDLLCDLARHRNVYAYLCLPPTAHAIPQELLTLWGKSARQMLTMLDQRQVPVTPQELPPVPASPAVLAAIQGAVCGQEMATGLAQDRSLQVWACPGQHREVESVYQMILAQIEADPHLRLTDIAVLVTDLASYLPTLHEVFGRHGRQMPFNLVDANAARISQYSAAVSSLLNLVGSPFTRRDVFALLTNPCYLAAVGADPGMARQWLTWAAALGIFHSYRRDDKCQACDTGSDEACQTCRNDAGHFDPQKLSDAHTWLSGLRRLRLGRIMTAPPTLPESGTVCAWGGAIPYADLETADLDVLERFSYGVEALYRACAALTMGEDKRSCTAWRDAVHHLLDTTLATPDDMPQERVIRMVLYEALDAFVRLEPCYPDGVSLAMVREYLQASLAEVPANYGRPLLDGITITSLRQGRLLPFRQIYVIGLGEGVFPGSPDVSTLDLRRGGSGEADLTIPDVNRQLMLDALLAARDRLVLTYNCRNLTEDAELNPCSVITQLESYVERHLLPPGLRFIEATAPLTGRSLQYLYQPADQLPWDPLVNYDPQDRLMALTDLASQADGLSSAATAQLTGILDAHASAVRARTTLSPPAEIETSPLAVPIRCLVDFLLNPAEARLKRQLYLSDQEIDDTAEQETEPFASAFPTNLRLSSDVQERYVRRAVQSGDVTIDPSGFFKPCYDDAHQRSLTPDGVFARLDAETWERGFVDAVTAAGGLRDLITRLSAQPCCTVSLGTPRQGHTTTVLPATPVPGLTRPMTLQGMLSSVWETNKGIETLVVTTSKAPASLVPDKKTGRWPLIKHILPPLLTYVALQAGTLPGPDGRTATDWIGGRPLTIHLTAADGLYAITFAMSPEEAQAYLQALGTDYLTQRTLDDLPLTIICREKTLWPLTEQMLDGYAERVQFAINESLEDSFKADKSRMALLSLIPNLQTPANAYELVDRRLMPLYRWRVLEEEA